MISAITIVKNAVVNDYPFLQAIGSILPVVDELIVNCGISSDKTWDLLNKAAIKDKRIKLIKTFWPKDSLALSEATNNVLDLTNGDWIFYIQADEVLHHESLSKVKEWISKAEEQGKQAITFNYHHISPDKNYEFKNYKDGKGYDFYDKEIRLFKKDSGLRSFGDGQGWSFPEQLTDFRGPQPAHHKEEKLLFSFMDIFHYSYCKKNMKSDIIDKKKNEYVYDKNNWKQLTMEHPKIMTERLNGTETN